MANTDQVCVTIQSQTEVCASCRVRLINRAFESEHRGRAGCERRDGVGVPGRTYYYDRARTRIAGRAAVCGVRSPIVWRHQSVFVDDQIAGRQLDAVSIAIRAGNVRIGDVVGDYRTWDRIGGLADAGVEDRVRLVQTNKAGVETIDRLVEGCWGGG